MIQKEQAFRMIWILFFVFWISRTNILTYSGVKNPLYHITNGELIEYRAQNFDADNCEDVEYQFTSEKIQLNTGDTIYLCSDGYTDQFGGKIIRNIRATDLKNFLHNHPGLFNA